MSQKHSGAKMSEGYRESVVSSGDFECFKAPLASMEDLSMVNTPMSTPTAGQSPRMRSRWSHRSSSGTTLEMALGPINEEQEEPPPPPPLLPPKTSAAARSRREEQPLLVQPLHNSSKPRVKGKPMLNIYQPHQS